MARSKRDLRSATCDGAKRQDEFRLEHLCFVRPIAHGSIEFMDDMGYYGIAQSFVQALF
jgi:hypothetical protein